MKAICGWVLGVVLLAVVPVQATSFDADWRAVFSRVQAMHHGYYGETEWQEVFGQLTALRADAERNRRLEQVIEIDVLEAMILADLRRAPEQALALLERTRRTYDRQPLDNMKRVYVQLAEVHAQLGDENAITELIRQFQQSPHFDPVTYAFTGGTGPNDPLLVTRPRAQGRDSITVTTMERSRSQARVAPGRIMPALEGFDADGRPVNLQALRGRYVLVDFWFPEWPAWRRDLPNLRASYHRYRSAGFEVVGIPISRDAETTASFVRAERIDWPQWRVDRRVPGQLGIFGEARNFLVDPNGMIVARDIRGADLDALLSQRLP